MQEDRQTVWVSELVLMNLRCHEKNNLVAVQVFFIEMKQVDVKFPAITKLEWTSNY